MTRLGDFDYSGLLYFKQRIDQLQEHAHAFQEECLKELVSRLFAKTVARTPVLTGELRRGWSIGPIQHVGSQIQIEIINPVEYAMYVEYGHRTKDHKGWVEGRFMLTTSIEELERELPAILERKLEQFIKEHLRW
ncbi:HK97 gp10 family phage protein [Paenibacillus chondroitinus]|uniref:HK97 gp10 family phage protein n=1 Tax=Paenibacillus chondroitinus TaxID=59842 RepID=A0ABU6D8L3_9BACL|nr:MULTISPECIES: HK97 gp10 family phage protein [Paenibacillus]MCY9658121.1 HK97 gp10 family phage protein [Paenibacillus anseongense]MEB4793217.1 HK97 gp10 family phage protein [Paenibacillus chondroitinus]